MAVVIQARYRVLGLGAEAVGEGFGAPGAGEEVAEGVVFEVGDGGAVGGGISAYAEVFADVAVAVVGRGEGTGGRSSGGVGGH